ncbi:MAG: tetratricopeptide repeat protein, partial [Methanobacterium sp.]
MNKWLWVPNKSTWKSLDKDGDIELYNNDLSDANEGDLLFVYKQSPYRNITHIFHLYRGNYQDNFKIRSSDCISLYGPVRLGQLSQITGFQKVKYTRKGIYKLPHYIGNPILDLIKKNNPISADKINAFINPNEDEINRLIKVTNDVQLPPFVGNVIPNLKNDDLIKKSDIIKDNHLKKWLLVSNNVLDWVALDEDEIFEFNNKKHLMEADVGDLILVYKTSPHKKITHISHLHSGKFKDCSIQSDDRMKLSGPVRYKQLLQIPGFSQWLKRPQRDLHEIPEDIWESILNLLLKNNPMYSQTINAFVGESIQPGELEKYYKQATKLSQHGEMKKAIKLFDLILDFEDNCLPALYWKGKALEQLGRHNEAIEVYERLLQIESTCEAALRRKGICHHIKGDIDISNKCLDDVLHENPQDVEANLNRGYNLQKENSYEESIEYFDQVLELDKKNKDALRNKGFSLLELGKYEQSIYYYNRVLELDVNDADIWYYKGYVQVHLGQNVRALASYNKALEINPQFYEALYNKGVVLMNLGNENEAMDSFDEALKLDDKSSDPHVAYAQIVNEKNLSNTASDYLNKAITLRPDDPNPYFYLGKIFKSQGKHRDAIKFLDKALELDPECTFAWH